MMAFELMKAAQKEWLRLRYYNPSPVASDVKFVNGINKHEIKNRMPLDSPYTGLDYRSVNKKPPLQGGFLFTS
jgi:hypothetical protein